MDTVLPEIGTAAGVVKVVTWLKLLAEKTLGIKIEGYAAYVLVFLVAAGWEVGNVLISGGTLSLSSLSPSILTAAKAIVTYGLANIGLFGQPGKDFISKPVL